MEEENYPTVTVAENANVTPELTPLEKLKADLARKLELATQESKERIETAKLTASINLLDNTGYVDIITQREYRQANITKLSGLITTINAITPVKLPGEGDVKINCYAINDRLFGTEIGLLLGIIQTASTAFVQEQKDTILTILKLPLALVEDMQQAFGTTAYFSKRTLSKYDEIKGNYEQAKALLIEIADKLALNPLDIAKFSETLYNLHFDQATKRAESKLKEFQLSVTVDADQSFTLTA